MSLLKNDFAHWDTLLNRPIKLAFFDIDGTLLGLDGNYSQRVKSALQSLQKVGVKTSIASGRPVFAAQFLIDELDLRDAGLFYTGALGFEPVSQKPLFDHMLDSGLCLEILNAAGAKGLHSEVYGFDHYWANRLSELNRLHSEHLRSIPYPYIADLTDIVQSQNVYKLLFAVTEASDHSKLYQLEAEFPSCIFAYAKMAAKPDWLFVSVISRESCKVRAFDALLDFHGVHSENVIAFGDAQSDMTFIQKAGIGVAMGNASDAVKATADIVTSPVWNEGVAEVVERHLALMGH